MPFYGRFTTLLSNRLSPVIISLFVLSLVVACGGDDEGPAQVNGPEPMVVPDGTFVVTATEIYKSCDRPNTWNGDFAIAIDAGDFTMGDDWSGTWDGLAGRARGESIRDRQEYRDCIVTIWTAVNVTFASADEFSGNITYTRRVSDGGACNTPCNVTWGISGTRK